jgi:hypothetical protein
MAALVASGQLPGLQPAAAALGAAMRAAAAAGLPLLAAGGDAAVAAAAAAAGALPLAAPPAQPAPPPGAVKLEPQLSLARGAVTVVRQGNLVGDAPLLGGAAAAQPLRHGRKAGADEDAAMEEAEALVPRGDAGAGGAGGALQEAGEPVALLPPLAPAPAPQGAPAVHAPGGAAAPPAAPPGCPPVGRVCELLLAQPDAAARLAGALRLTGECQVMARDAVVLLRCARVLGAHAASAGRAGRCQCSRPPRAGGGPSAGGAADAAVH